MRVRFGFIFFIFMDTATGKKFREVKKEFGGIKKYLMSFREEVNERFKQSEERFDRFVEAASETFATRAEFEDFDRYIRENMFTKQDFMDHMSQLDEIYLEFKRTRDNNILIGKQLCDLDDTVAGHGKRITVLEGKVL